METSRLAVYRAQEALGVLIAADGPADAADEPAFGIAPVADQSASLQLLRTDLKLFAAEEVLLSFRLGRQGRFVVLREGVITSGRKVRTFSAWEIACVFGQFALLKQERKERLDDGDLVADGARTQGVLAALLNI